MRNMGTTGPLCDCMADKLTITCSIDARVTCPLNLGYPTVDAVEMYMGEYGGGATQVNPTNAISSSMVLNPALLLATRVTTGLTPGAVLAFTSSVTVALRPSYLVVVVAKQTLPNATVNSYVWYSIVYDLKLDMDAGIVAVEIRAPSAVASDGFVATNATRGALSNNLTDNFTRLANKTGTATAFVATCAASVWDPTATGYTRASQETSIGACASKCHGETDCQLFQFDTAATANNCTRFLTGINKLSLSVAPQATASTTTQCWSKKTMLDATIKNDCQSALLGSGYGFTDAGCRRITATNGVLSQAAYCERFSTDEATCTRMTGCHWKGRTCQSVSAACDTGYIKNATTAACDSCGMGNTTTTAGVCVNCTTLNETTCRTRATARTANQEGFCRWTGSQCTNPQSNIRCETHYSQNNTTNVCDINALAEGAECGTWGATDIGTTCGKRCGALGHSGHDWRTTKQYCGKIPSGHWAVIPGRSGCDDSANRRVADCKNGRREQFTGQCLQMCS